MARGGHDADGAGTQIFTFLACDQPPDLQDQPWAYCGPAARREDTSPVDSAALEGRPTWGVSQTA